VADKPKSTEKTTNADAEAGADSQAGESDAVASTPTPADTSSEGTASASDPEPTQGDGEDPENPNAGDPDKPSEDIVAVANPSNEQDQPGSDVGDATDDSAADTDKLIDKNTKESLVAQAEAHNVEYDPKSTKAEIGQAIVDQGFEIVTPVGPNGCLTDPLCQRPAHPLTPLAHAQGQQTSREFI